MRGKRGFLRDRAMLRMTNRKTVILAQKVNSSFAHSRSVPQIRPRSYGRSNRSRSMLAAAYEKILAFNVNRLFGFITASLQAGEPVATCCRSYACAHDC